MRLFSSEFVNREVLRFYQSGFEIETGKEYPWADELPLLVKWIPFGAVSGWAIRDLRNGPFRTSPRRPLGDLVKHWETIVDDRLRYSENVDGDIVLWKRPGRDISGCVGCCVPLLYIIEMGFGGIEVFPRYGTDAISNSPCPMPCSVMA